MYQTVCSTDEESLEPCVHGAWQAGGEATSRELEAMQIH